MPRWIGISLVKVVCSVGLGVPISPILNPIVTDPVSTPLAAKLSALTAVCAAIDAGAGELAAARELAAQYLHEPAPPEKRRFSEQRLTELCLRDGFIDRCRPNPNSTNPIRPLLVHPPRHRQAHHSAQA